MIGGRSRFGLIGYQFVERLRGTPSGVPTSLIFNPSTSELSSEALRGIRSSSTAVISTASDW